MFKLSESSAVCKKLEWPDLIKKMRIFLFFDEGGFLCI